MARILESRPRRDETALPGNVPVLQPGDCLTRDEFERRYHRMKGVRAELVEGIVYMASPLRIRKHGEPHSQLGTLIGFYAAHTPGVMCGDNATVRLDLDNEPQPDVLLVIERGKGGQTRISADDYIEGAPELCVEIVASTAAYDLHQKKRAYRRNGVREYLAWLTEDGRILWWELDAGEYRDIPADDDGILKSRVFPGLWLDAAALLAGDLKKALTILQRGVESAEHAEFVDRLAKVGGGK